ncbi:DUF11 domain-containing protein [Arthrobacter sp. GMC3]|uniref:DUF7507 domain-containing protein n=1 Tax=Arthrobacter sp. GMC3 TaxID=2058894 RepID=UPI000CE44BEA|nr:DUF11 domain-containing protein [Arthrobacter sp. GMC3]
MTISIRRRFAVGFFLAIAVLLGLMAVPASAAPVEPLATSCDYANADGGGKYPTSICWIDFTGFNATEASSTEGQNLTMPLGEYTVSFNVIQRNVPSKTSRSTVASAPVGPFGKPGYYDGIGGKPLLYAESGNLNGGVNIAIRDFSISIKGTSVAGYSLVSASAETLDAYDGFFGESINWTSDQPLTMIDHAGEFTSGGGCLLPPSGDGTTNVWCDGASAGQTSAHGVIVAAPSATTISGAVTMTRGGEREAVAFGVQTARASVTKQVDRRVDSDESFDVSVTSHEGPLLGSATTGTAATATTGSTIVIPTGPITLAEAASAGSPGSMDFYNKSWSCTNARSGSATVLPTGGGMSKTLDLAAGDDVSCIVTNTALPATLALEKTVNVTSAAVGDSATFDFKVTNTGEIPLDSLALTEDSFSGSGALSAISCPTTTLPPGAWTTCHATYVVTQQDVDAGFVTNTATATAQPVNTKTVVNSNLSTVKFTTPATSALNVSKTADRRTSQTGEKITYTLKATNSGKVTLRNVTLTEKAFSGTGTLSGLTCDAAQPATLSPGQVLTCTARYTVTATDTITLNNTVTGAGTDPSNTVLTGDASATVTVVMQNLAVTGSQNVFPMLATTGGLALAGILLVVAARRRSTDSAIN